MLMRPCKTGYFSFSPGILLPSQEQPPNFTWAVTLLGGVPQNTSLDYSFWYVLKTWMKSDLSLNALIGTILVDSITPTA
jgi:hypothetical protein